MALAFSLEGRRLEPALSKANGMRVFYRKHFSPSPLIPLPSRERWLRSIFIVMKKQLMI